MIASNYQDVLDQLLAFGLMVTELRIGTSKPVRCRVEGDREKRGWYRLHELTTDRGDVLIVGSFGVWHGNNSNSQKVALRKTEISVEQRDALKKRIAEDLRQAEHARRADAERAAETAASVWERCSIDGADEHEYLKKKGVPAYELKLAPGGALVIPLCDGSGRVHGLQIIRTAAAAKKDGRPGKDFWPSGLAKKGRFHLIGAPVGVLLVAEGYATAATLHWAGGRQWPVAVAFDAGNIGAVVAELRKRYPRTRLLICADDDAFAKCIGCETRLVLADHPVDCPACAKPHGRINTGVSAASAAALELGVHGAWIKPTFSDEPARRDKFLERGIKDTDFNDLHLVEKGQRVREQIESKLGKLKWSVDGENARPTTSGAGGRGGKLRPIHSLSEMLKRYALVYGHSGTVFDRTEHCLISLSDMRDACLRRDLHRTWMEHPERAIVRVREVGFDPAGEDPEVTCNLWAGWPTEPRAGSCEKLLDLLRYLCSLDRDPEAVFDWILRWCAYPIQHPGAKMRSALVVHGPQGSGKSFFFECVMAIFGQYGRVIGQQAVEDKFNDWASRRLFLIADEVVARSDVYHIKNQLKALITGDWIRINPKNVAAYDERNHVNIVFLSNEGMPVVLEEDDRRHCVVWTPHERAQAYYAEVRREAAEGGIAALHHYLLHLDLGDFHPGTRPPETDAKSTLIKLGLDSPERWHDALVTGDIDGLKPLTGKAEDWFRIYEIWCRRNNVRAAPAPKFIHALDRKRGVVARRERYNTPSGAQKNPLSILYLGDRNPPEGTARAAWLGEQVVAVAQQLDDYRESK